MNTNILRRGLRAVRKATEGKYQNFQIRVHRALSWFERALELDEIEQPDGRLLYAWISISALYGAWDKEAGHPMKDFEARNAFLRIILCFDEAGMIPQRLCALQSDILWLLENKFLDPRFWKNPSASGNTRSKYHRAIRLYHDRSWLAILEFTFERIAVLRGQIVHGAATRGSRLNRSALSRCCKIIEDLLPVMLQLVIENRANDDWPPLCYPPIEET